MGWVWRNDLDKNLALAEADKEKINDLIAKDGRYDQDADKLFKHAISLGFGGTVEFFLAIDDAAKFHFIYTEDEVRGYGWSKSVPLHRISECSIEIEFDDFTFKKDTHPEQKPVLERSFLAIERLLTTELKSTVIETEKVIQVREEKHVDLTECKPDIGAGRIENTESEHDSALQKQKKEEIHVEDSDFD